MSDNVFQLPGAEELPSNPLALAPRHPGWCRHESVVLDEHSRTVLCADLKCRAVLDPFNFLRDNAHTIQSAWSSYRQVRQQAAEIAERVAALKKEEQRLRAMVKRLQDKAPVLNTRGKL